MRTIVTTSHEAENAIEDLAKNAALILQVPFVERSRLSLAHLKQQYGAENIIVAYEGAYKLYTELGEFMFHPSMSVPRIKSIKQGRGDHMVEAMALKPGDTVLDCTLGLGADAIVSSFVTGRLGQVVAIESSPELAFIVSIGLKRYPSDSAILQEAMAGIEVICSSYQRYLENLADNSFDIVYFDPMFRFPRKKSSSMQPLRGIVNSEPTDSGAVSEAVRVARQRVVLKENSFSKEFSRLGFNKIVGGRYSPVAFGVIEKQEAGI